MGGKLVLTKISSDGVVKSTKVGTSFLNKMNSVKLLDESYFDIFCARNNIILKNKLEVSVNDHNNYEIDDALFCPYHYGVLVVDFKNKKVFSLNNYINFLNSGTRKLFSEYEKLGRRKQTEMSMNDSKDNLIKMESFYEENSANINTVALVTSCISMGADLLINKKRYDMSIEKDYFSFVAKLYGQDLSLLTYEQCQNHIREFDRTENGFHSKYDSEVGHLLLDGWDNIQVYLPGWELVNNHYELEDTTRCLMFYKNKNLLTEEEILLWNDEIIALRKEKQEEEDKMLKDVTSKNTD